MPKLLPTTVVGSYTQPEWLVDRSVLQHHGVPRAHAHDIWRIAPELLEQAQDDATILAIRDMERAGIDIVTDGEIRRVAEVETRDAMFLRANATKATKITLPGPFTLSRQVRNEFYKDDEELAMDYAAAVNAELLALKATGVDVVQLDEPWVRTAPEQAKRFGIKAINRALEGVPGTTVVHVCFGYAAVVAEKPTGYSFLAELGDTIAGQISIEAAQPKLDLGVLRDLAGKTIMLGVLDLGDPTAEIAETVAGRIRNGLRYVAADKLIPAPDCGMKYLPRATAFAKLQALAEGAAIVRRELG